MKSNELMMGDFYQYETEICEVCIPPEGETIITGLGDAIWIESKNFYGFVSISDLKPISITPEILEKNGFIWNEERCLYESEYFDLRHIINTTYRIGDTMMMINFIHELQHALKLCNIDKEIKL